MSEQDEANKAGVQHILSTAAEIKRQSALEDLDAAQLKNSPFLIYGAVLRKDGNAWEAAYGPNPMVGVFAYGDSPAEAVSAFNKSWHKKH